MKFNRNSLEVLSNFLLEFPASRFNNTAIEYTDLYPTPASISQVPLVSLSYEYEYDITAVFAIMADLTDQTDLTWERLDTDLFPYEEDGPNDEWYFISGTDADLTPIQISRRISYLLEHGVPDNYENFEEWYTE